MTGARPGRWICLTMMVFVLAACGGGDGRTVLTVYSPHGKELLEHYETAFEAANPTIDVQWVDMGSQNILERLRAEGRNPQADLWFGAPAEIFERGAREGLLAPYEPSWSAAVDAEAHDPEHRWYGTYLTPEVIAYNTDAVRREEAPRDWDDVLDPKWRDRILIRNPIESGSMRAIWGAMILRSIRETGSEEAGYEWLRRLDANVKEYTADPSILYQKLGRQEGVVTLYNMPDIVIQQQRGYHVDYVFPSSGTPLLVDGIAIVAGTELPEEARAYYEFVTSREALLTASERFTRIPARTDIPLDSLPEWVRRAREQITPMPLDRAVLAERLDEWMRYWDANIRNQYRGR
ncbi:MAG TPA: extracellular solute-binding protein [Gemmatimonadaceae bacterium]|nr:extracellular solute-binding protein [Gemmatimonadaceae bacterium]